MLPLTHPAFYVGFDGGDDDRPTLVVDIDGEEKTITLPEGWMHQDTIKDKYLPKDQFARELERRVAAKTKGLVKPDDLLSDEEFLGKVLGVDDNRGRALELLGIDPEKLGGDVDVAEIRRKVTDDVTAQFTEKEIKPRDAKIEEQNALIEQLRERDFRAEFLSAAAEEDIHEDMLEPLAVLYRRQFRFDADENGWFRVGEDGELEMSLNPEPGGPRHVTVAEALKEERRSGKHKTWFKAPGSGGGGYQGGGRGGKRKVTFEEFKAMSDAQKRQLRDEDDETWREMMKLKAEEGSKALFDKQQL